MVIAYTIHVNKKLKFDDCRMIVLWCKRWHFIRNGNVRERKQNGTRKQDGTKQRTEWSENGMYMVINYFSVHYDSEQDERTFADFVGASIRSE